MCLYGFMAHLVLSSGPQLCSLLSYPGGVPAPLPLLLPLDVNSPGLPQSVHLVVHSLQLLVPPVLQALPHLLMFSPARLEWLQELKMLVFNQSGQQTLAGF